MALPIVTLLLSGVIFLSAPTTTRIFADSSDIDGCASSFSGELSEPFNAESQITINAINDNYDVEFDYVVANGDEGASYFVKSSAAEPSSPVLVEGETISVLLTSGESIPEDAFKLYHQDVSDCDILFNSSSIPDSKRLILSTVSIEEQAPSKFLVRVLIPDAESAINFTKLVVAYVTNPEASVSYNVPNVAIAEGSEEGALRHFLLFQSGESLVKIGKTYDNRTVTLALFGEYNCNTDEKPHLDISPNSLSGLIVIHDDGAHTEGEVEIELHNFDLSVRRNDQIVIGTAEPVNGTGSVNRMKWILPEKIDCETPTDQEFPTGNNLIHAKIFIDGVKHKIFGEELPGGIFFEANAATQQRLMTEIQEE